MQNKEIQESALTGPEPQTASEARSWELKQHQREQRMQEQEKSEDADKAYRIGRLRDLVLDEVKQHFRPELLNRSETVKPI